jgi:deoxycytidine triphosphate deaminase
MNWCQFFKRRVPQPERPPRFADSPSDADQRFERWRSVDPFPEIAPALLNSADIADYVAATGMISPFDEAKLKPASYPLALGGKILWWDNKSRRRRRVTIAEGDDFVLQPNSIAFVTLEPFLRLPDYIAMRFNLKITNVYRGLLLGTGPLVDPGFAGRLSFPLHNLTTNEYRFRGGEDVIWVEFTKLSTNPQWLVGDRSDLERLGTYARYKKTRSRRDVEDYVAEAISDGHIWSSISEALHQAETAASKTRLYSAAGVVALAALVVSVVGVSGALFWNEWKLPQNGQIRRDERTITNLQKEVADLHRAVRALQKNR